MSILASRVPDWIGEARKHHIDAGKSTNLEHKAQSFLAASKCYIQAANSVTGSSELKRSIAFLANVCAQQALLCKKGVSVPTPEKPTDSALTISSNRLLHLAHQANLKRMEHVSY